MRSVLIIGASRGIGLGLVQRHLNDGWDVDATTRDGSAPEGISGVRAHRLDVTDADELKTMMEPLDEPFDRVIHNAGIKHGTRDQMMTVNAEAPIRVVQALIDSDLVVRDGVVAIMTSQMGSRGKRGGSLGDYGDSKAALNDEFRLRTDDWREAGVIATVMHPGWVRTDMGGSSASISVEESTAGITEVLDDLDASQHGQFLTWRGDQHPW